MSNLQVGLISAIPNIVATAMVIVAAHSDRTGEQCLHIAAASAAAALGFLGCALATSPAFAVMCLSLATAGCLSAHGQLAQEIQAGEQGNYGPKGRQHVGTPARA